MTPEPIEHTGGRGGVPIIVTPPAPEAEAPTPTDNGDKA
jgi:hypothetical protein